MTPLPGDFACVSMGGAGGQLVALGERLCGDAFTEYQHAFVYTGEGHIVEAEPGGAREVPLGGYGQHPVVGQGDPPDGRAAQAIVRAALEYVGTPYSWLDYAAIGLRRLHVRGPGLKRYIASTRHMICSPAGRPVLRRRRGAPVR